MAVKTPPLDPVALGVQMLSAAKGEFGRRWPGVQDYAETAFKNLAQSLVMIQRLRLTRKINKEQARLHLEIQKNASRSVMLALEGLSLLMVEQAINAGLAVVRDAVNRAVGFALL